MKTQHVPPPHPIDPPGFELKTAPPLQTVNSNAQAFICLRGPGDKLLMERPAVGIDGATVSCDSCGAACRSLFVRNANAPRPGVLVCESCGGVTW